MFGGNNGANSGFGANAANKTGGFTFGNTSTGGFSFGNNTATTGNGLAGNGGASQPSITPAQATEAVQKSPYCPLESLNERMQAIESKRSQQTEATPLPQAVREASNVSEGIAACFAVAPTPPDVLAQTHMHLHKDQVRIDEQSRRPSVGSSKDNSVDSLENRKQMIASLVGESTETIMVFILLIIHG